MKGAALLETMARQVAAECERFRSEARSEAEAIVAEARAQAADLRAKTLDATAAEMRRLDERWRQKADAEAAKAALMMKNQAVHEVLGHVRERIRAIAEGPRFRDVLDALLAEVMDVAEDDIVVLAPQQYADHVRDWLAANGRGGVPVEGSASLWDGVAVQDPARTYRISNTLSGRFARVEEEARKLCMTQLFEPGT